MNKKVFFILALLCAVVQGAWAWSGSGTADSPYILSTGDDWATFVTRVNAGTDADKHYKLADTWDNSTNAVTVAVGTEAHPFAGTFDGNGKTLCVSITDTDTQNHGTAPFRHVKGATIKNLTVEGSVTGMRHAAGLAGIVHEGTTTVSGCVVKTTVNNSLTSTDDGFIGGVIGHGTSATIVIENTVFSGYLNNTNNYAGGLVGWSGANITFINSFFTGTHGNGLFHPIALHHKDDRPKYFNFGAYYISTTPPTVIDNQIIGLAGKPVYKEKPSGDNYTKITAADDAEYYVEALSYIVRSWDAENKKVVSTLTPCPTYTVLSGNHEDDWIALYDGYYVVKSNTKYKVLNIMGDDVHLILADGALLECVHVKLEGNHKLYIYSDSEEGTGRLFQKNYHTSSPAVETGAPTLTDILIDGEYNDAAGIGGDEDTDMGSLYVHGGIVEATNGGTGAAIGGGNDASIGGEVVIYGGKVTAQSINTTHNGAGIGGGLYRSQGGPVTIYGGTVVARGGSKSAGIGGGEDGDYGNGGHGGTVTIYGGDVTASSEEYGAGIGGGNDGNGGTVTIYGGDVKATGGETAACIGGGEDGDQGGAVKIYGGNVTASVKNNNPTYHAFCNAIGGGKSGKGGEVHFLGGQITLLGGKRARAVGGGKSLGTIKFGDNMKVSAGNGYQSIERIFTNGEREAACQWRNYAIIQPCDHTTPTEGDDKTEAITYSIDNEIYHTKHCRYCNTTWQEEHEGTICSKCGKTSFYQFTVHHPGTEKDTYGESFTIAIGASLDFYLPSCKNVPEGYIFKGWEMNPAPNDVNRWAAVRGGDPGTDINMPAGTSVKVYLGQTPANFYARFLYDFTPTWTWAENGSSASVTLSHKDLNAVTLSSTISSADLMETVTIVNDDETTSEQEVKIGTRYTATCIYELNGYEYTFADNYDIIDVPETENISLQDNADNSETISEKYNCPVNATLTGRTLYKDGSWNTLCLPFDLVLEGSPLAGATVKTLESSDYDISTGKLTLNFTTGSLTTLRAGTPYLVKWESGENLVNPVFSGVTVSTIGGGHADTHYVDFVGSFSPVSLEANDKTVLYLGASNKLYYPSQDRTMGSCRAVFRLHNGLTVGDLPTPGQANARAFVLNFGDGEATGIVDAEADSSLFTLHSSLKEGWYDMQGRRLSGKPTARGIYINNGKKIVIK